VKHNRALHEHVIVLTVLVESVPRIGTVERLEITEQAERCWRLTARYGFMERPDLPALLRRAPQAGCAVRTDDVTYYVGRETIVPSERTPLIPRWQEAIFAALSRNSAHVSDFYRLPLSSTVEIGREIAI